MAVSCGQEDRTGPCRQTEMGRFNMKLVMNEISQECKLIHTKTRTGNSAEHWTKAVFPLATILWHGGHGAEIRTGRNLGLIAVLASSLDLCQVKKWPIVNYRKNPAIHSFIHY